MASRAPRNARGDGVRQQHHLPGRGGRARSLDGKKIEDLAKAGDAEATRIWETAIAAAAIGITNLVMAFSPYVVVPGGGLGRWPGFSGPLTAMAGCPRQPACRRSPLPRWATTPA